MSAAPLTITRKLEFDAGHRIPNHSSKCRNVHGHRYILECTVTGPLSSEKGSSSEGMVVDFGMLKELMNKYVVNDWDHAMLVWDGDTQLLKALTALDSFRFPHKTVRLPCIPTVENLAEHAFNTMVQALIGTGLKLTHLRLYETPNCWADRYAS